MHSYLFNQMENVIAGLAAALRERLAIISDQNSRRDPEAHAARLRAVSEKIEKLEAALPKPIDPQLPLSPAQKLRQSLGILGKQPRLKSAVSANTTRRSTVR